MGIMHSSEGEMRFTAALIQLPDPPMRLTSRILACVPALPSAVPAGAVESDTPQCSCGSNLATFVRSSLVFSLWWFYFLPADAEIRRWDQCG